jgi:hypothetical protein
MSEMIAVPRSEWMKLRQDLDFIVKAIVPLAKGFKRSEWMTTEEISDPLDPEHLPIGPDRLKQIRASGRIRYRKVGRRVEYLRKDIADYKDSKIIIPKKLKA